MKIPSSMALVIALGAATLPAVAAANPSWQSANGEIGVTVRPDHRTSQLSRAEVTAAMNAARQNGTLAVKEIGYPPPPKVSGPARTRAEVTGDLQRESAGNRQARREGDREG